MHALKDYYGMVAMLEEFPAIHQTFNLVPSMMVQIEEYAEGRAQDPFLRCALKPAEELTSGEQEFLLKYFFQANPPRMIYRYKRYGELYEASRAAAGNVERLRRGLGAPGLRDLQVLSQLAWFDEIFQAEDADVRRLIEKGRDYTLEDQALMGRKQVEICAKVLPAYRAAAERGQVELSVTPFYHPIMPLLIDSSVASQSHPGVVLPTRFAYPDDARYQVEQARAYAKAKLGFTPAGMWPSEGSVSDATLALATEAGVEWMATDNGVLSSTLGHLAGVQETYRPYVWRQNGREMKMVFRDRFLSDLIGFHLLAHGAGGGSRAPGRPDQRKLPADPRRGPRRRGARYSGRRKRLGTLPRKRPAVSQRALPAHQRGPGHVGRDRGQRRLRRCRRRRLSAFTRAVGSTPTTMSGSAQRKTTRRGSTCWRRAASMTAW